MYLPIIRRILQCLRFICLLRARASYVYELWANKRIDCRTTSYIIHTNITQWYRYIPTNNNNKYKRARAWLLSAKDSIAAFFFFLFILYYVYYIYIIILYSSPSLLLLLFYEKRRRRRIKYILYVRWYIHYNNNNIIRAHIVFCVRPGYNNDIVTWRVDQRDTPTLWRPVQLYVCAEARDLNSPAIYLRLNNVYNILARVCVCIYARVCERPFGKSRDDI